MSILSNSSLFSCTAHREGLEARVLPKPQNNIHIVEFVLTAGKGLFTLFVQANLLLYTIHGKLQHRPCNTNYA